MRRAGAQLAAALLSATKNSSSSITRTIERTSLLLPSVISNAASQALLHRSATRGIRYMTFPPKQQPRFSWGGSLDPNATAVVWSLIAANGAVFLLWRTDPYFASKHFVVSLDSLRSGRLWTTVTSAFSQQDISHLGSNMISLYFFGSDVGRLFGGRKLLMLYLAGGVVGSLAHVGWSYYKEQQAGLRARWGGLVSSRGAMGASAAVNAIVLLDIFLFPTRTILLYGFIPLPAALLGMLWLWNDLGGALGSGSSPVAHAGHLGGAATGLLFWLAFKRGKIRPSGW